MEFIKRNPKIFIISGKARSGKGEISNIIKKRYSDKDAITISFGHYIKDYAKRVSNWDGNEDTKPRELLQQLGIELIKEKIDSKLFIRRILEDILVFSYFYDIIIINDARLLDEINALKENYPNAISIRVIRKNYENGMTESENNHITEVDLDKYNDFDFSVINDNYNNLYNQVNAILDEV